MGQDAQLNPAGGPSANDAGVPMASDPGVRPSETSAPTWLPTGLAMLGFTIIAWTMLRGAKRRGMGARQQVEVSPRERLAQLRQNAERERTQDYASDAVELTQRLAAQLDAKAALLEELIAQADERLELLGGVMGDDGRAPGATAGNLGRSGLGAGAGDDQTTSAGVGVTDGRGRGEPMTEGFRRSLDEAFASERPDAMRREVFRLADAGLGAEEIALQTQQPIGQVRLMLALRSA